MSAYRYLVAGAGMQGTAAAYDLARYGEADEVVLADSDQCRAEASAERIQRLTGRTIARAVQLDASDHAAVAAAAEGMSVTLSCVPYKLHQTVAEGCLRAGCSVVDMGNDTDVTLQTLARDDDFQAKNVTFVPDTGLAPGLVNSLALYLMEQLDTTDSVRLYCGGLPQNPKPPLNYSLRFSIEGLVGEYVDEAIAVRDHQVVRLDTLQELEAVHVEGFGQLEAFTTSSGTSTAPFTFAERVRSYEYKTLRHPGHCAIMRVFRDFGFWDEEPVEVDGASVTPLHVWYRLMGPRLEAPEDHDVVVTRAVARGSRQGRQAELQVDIIDRYDDATGFSAMERLTGFSTSIIAIAVASGEVRTGAVRYEEALSGRRFIEEIGRRGISLHFRDDAL